MSTGAPNLPFSYRKVVDNPRKKPLLKPKSPTVFSSQYVYLWWDAENLPIKTLEELRTLLKKVEACLQSLDPDLVLAPKVYAVGTSSCPVAVWAFQSLGFTVLDPPKYNLICKHPDCGETYRKSTYKPSIYERVKEAADRIIVQGFIGHILQNTGSKNIMLLSGDVDFALPLSILKRNGYKVFLAVGEDSKEELITSASIVWRMKEILKGVYQTLRRDPHN